MTITNEYRGLRGRVVIITGAGQGIGRRYALNFAAQGAIPVIAEFNGDAGERVAREVEQQGGKALAIQTDVSNTASTLNMAKQTLSKFGRIDCLLNNAAVFSKITIAPFWELPEAEWRQAMDVNITGSFLCARAVVPAMQERKWGRIVNVSSGTMIMGRPNYLHYITSKAAMVGMTRSMSRELGPWNVTVNTFWPGVTKTEVERPSVPAAMFEKFAEMQCLHRLTDMDDLSAGMMFLCSDDAGFITGQSLAVDGGLAFI
jgi:NAD(P)-dependent dehydrogenase (short-subunit alcohol dehydrogenase family)